jgi:hypothetical protein
MVPLMEDPLRAGDCIELGTVVFGLIKWSEVMRSEPVESRSAVRLRPATGGPRPRRVRDHLEMV